jgi:hypothetical protein
MNNLAEALCSLNRLNEAQDLYRDALEFRIINLSPDHPDIGTSMNNLAVLLFRLNRLKESEKLQREALHYRI